MATFKVGQRVRIVNGHDIAYIVGREGVIVRPGVNWEWIVEVTGCPHDLGRPSNLPETHYGLDGKDLAPLTDPGADAFLERMRKLKPYDEPKVEPVRQGTPIWK